MLGHLYLIFKGKSIFELGMQLLSDFKSSKIKIINKIINKQNDHKFK